MPVVNNGVESYQGDQLVAEQPYAGLVQEQLRRMGIAASEIESSDSLGLRLLNLAGVESAAAVLRRDPALAEAAGRAQQSRSQTAAVMSDLDYVLLGLRQSMAAAFGGWVATVGKNRILDRVQGSPYIKGGVGQPDPVGTLSLPPVPPQPAARVAVLDTRLYAHPDLIGRFVGESVADLHEPRSTQGHSTFVAGLIAQRAPAAELLVRTVLDDDGSNASSWDVATTMVSVLDAGVCVLNLSLGCATLDRVPPLCLSRAVQRLIPSVVVVAAAGNNGVPDSLAAASGLTPDTPIYPAAIDGVVGVGAYDPAAGTAEPAPFSPVVPWVDLLAPGVRVRSTFLPGQVQLVRRGPDGQLMEAGTADFGQPGYASWDGTSFAAANVTGAIAALIGAGQLSAYEALDQLRNPASPSGDIIPWSPG